MPSKLPRPEIWFGLAAVVLAADYLSKAWVLATFSLREMLVVTSFFNLVLVYNPGASFSFLADAGGWQRWFFSGLALVISFWLLVLIRRHARENLMAASLALILGGAVGNLVDRLRFGAVVDFIQVHYAGWYYPAFNVADSAITVGVMLLLWQQFTHKDAP